MSDVLTVRITPPSGHVDVTTTPFPVNVLDVSAMPRPFGEFRLVEVLGQGGMGTVYRAVEGRLGREVALKVLNPSHSDSAEYRARFQREARAQAAVEHDHVVTIFRVGEADGVPYLTMPVLKGVTLSQYLTANPNPPLEELLRVGRELAEGLAAAHAKGLIHRDVKPGNVWLEGPTGRVKILDFGLARVLTTDDDASDPVTGEGVTVGTVEYMSPEQARGESLDGRSDVYSLGAVLYEMATGRRPFRGPNNGATLARLLSNAPTPPRELNPHLPPALNDLILSMMEKDAARRPASAECVAETLREIEAIERTQSPKGRLSFILQFAEILLSLGGLVTTYLIVAQIFGLPIPGGKPDLNRPEVLIRHLLRDFERIYVRDATGVEIPMQPGAPFPPSPFEVVRLEMPTPHAAVELRKKLERGIPWPMKAVRRIDLSHTPATEADARWVSERLPRCEVRWHGGVVAPRE